MFVRHVVPCKNRAAARERGLFQKGGNGVSLVGAGGARLDHGLAPHQRDGAQILRQPLHFAQARTGEIRPLPVMQHDGSGLAFDQQPAVTDGECLETVRQAGRQAFIHAQHVNPAPAVAAYETVNARYRKTLGRKKSVHGRNIPPGNDGERAAEPAVNPLKASARPRIEHDVVGMVGEFDQRTVEIQKQGGGAGLRHDRRARWERIIHIGAIALTNSFVLAGPVRPVPRRVPSNQPTFNNCQQRERAVTLYRGMAACLLLSSLAATTAARAGGFYIKEQSAQGLGRAFAGMSAFAPDASAVYFNPAALTTIDELVGTGAVYGLILEAEQEDFGTVRTVPGLDDPIPVLGRSGGNPFDPLIPAANFYVAAPADDDGLFVGFGMNSPFGLNNKYDGDFFGRFDSIKSLLFTINLQPTIAYKLGSKFSVGAGLDIQYAEVTLTNALPNLDPALGDGFFRVEGNDWNLGWNAGLHLDLGDLQMGAHYRSGIDYVLQGEAQIRGLFGPLEPLNGIFSASAPLSLPDIVSGGIAYSVGDTGARVLFDLTWFDWSDFDEIEIGIAPGLEFGMIQNYKDTWSFALGGEYDLNERLTLRLGSQYDETPTRNAFRNTRVPDGDRWWAAGGLSYRIRERFTVDFSYAHVFVTTERIDVTEEFFEGTPAQIDVRTVSRNTGDADIVALGVTARF